MIARDWYHELRARVHDLVNEACFGCFYSGLPRSLSGEVVGHHPLFPLLLHRGDGDDPLQFFYDHWLKSRG